MTFFIYYTVDYVSNIKQTILKYDPPAMKFDYTANTNNTHPIFWNSLANIPKSVSVTDTNHFNFLNGDVVSVKFFGITGIVLEKHDYIDNSASYIILYKDNNHVLQKIELMDWMIYKPTKESLSPFSLEN